MGDFGVGSRGSGDFFAHRQLATIIDSTGADVGVDEMDDAASEPDPVDDTDPEGLAAEVEQFLRDRNGEP